MPKYKVNHVIVHKMEVYRPGDTVEMDQRDAHVYEMTGRISQVKRGRPKAKKRGKQPTN